MVNSDVLENRASLVGSQKPVADKSIHPAWLALIRYCSELQPGEIEVLKIQDGLPVLAEVVRKKIKFTP
jgi:hypothetical protein